jgi:hypothetical protein
MGIVLNLADVLAVYFIRHVRRQLRDNCASPEPRME